MNNITKQHNIHNTDNVLNVNKHYSYKTYIRNNYTSHIAYLEHHLYNIYDNIVFNNTNNIYIYIYKHINQ